MLMIQNINFKNIIESDDLSAQKQVIDAWLKETQSIQFNLDFLAFLQLVLKRSQSDELIDRVIVCFERIAPLFSAIQEVHSKGDETYAMFLGRVDLFQSIASELSRFLRKQPPPEHSVRVAYILAYLPKDILSSIGIENTSVVATKLLEAASDEKSKDTVSLHKIILALHHLNEAVPFMFERDTVLKLFDLMHKLKDPQILNTVPAILGASRRHSLASQKNFDLSKRLIQCSVEKLEVDPPLEQMIAIPISLIFASSISEVFNAGASGNLVDPYLPKILKLCATYDRDEGTLSNLLACASWLSIALIRRMKSANPTTEDSTLLDHAMEVIKSHAEDMRPQICTNRCAALTLIIQEDLLRFYEFPIDHISTIVSSLKNISDLENKDLSKKAILDISIVLYFLFGNEKKRTDILAHLSIISDLCDWVAKHLSHYEAACANMLFAMVSLATSQPTDTRSFSDTMSPETREAFLNTLSKALLRSHETLRQNAALLIGFLCLEKQMRSIFQKTDIVSNVCKLSGDQNLQPSVTINTTMACAQMAAFQEICDLMLERHLSVVRFLYERLSDDRDPQIVYNALHALSSLLGRLTEDMLNELYKKELEGKPIRLGDLKTKVLTLLTASHPSIRNNAVACLAALITKYPQEFEEDEYKSLFKDIENVAFNHLAADSFDNFKNACALWFILGERLKYFEGTPPFFDKADAFNVKAAQLYLGITHVFTGKLPQSVIKHLSSRLDSANEGLLGIILHILRLNAFYGTEVFIADDASASALWPTLMTLLKRTKNPNILDSIISLLYYRLRTHRDEYAPETYSELVKVLYHLLPRTEKLSTKLNVWQILYRRVRVSPKDRDMIQGFLETTPLIEGSYYESFLHQNMIKYSKLTDETGRISSWRASHEHWRLSYTAETTSSEKNIWTLKPNVQLEFMWMLNPYFQLEFRPNGAVYLRTSAFAPLRCVTLPLGTAYQPWSLRIDADAVRSTERNLFEFSALALGATDLKLLLDFSRWISKNGAGKEEYYGQSIRQRWSDVLAALESIEIYGIDADVIKDLNDWPCAPKNVALVFKSEADPQEYSKLFAHTHFDYKAYHRLRANFGQYNLALPGKKEDFIQKCGFDPVSRILFEETNQISSSFFGLSGVKNLLAFHSKSTESFTLDMGESLIRSIDNTAFFWGASEHVILDFSLISSEEESFLEHFLFLYTMTAPYITIKMPKTSSTVQSILDAIPYVGTYRIVGLEDHSTFKCVNRVVYWKQETFSDPHFNALWNELNWRVEQNLEPSLSVRGDDYGNFSLWQGHLRLASFTKAHGDGYTLSVVQIIDDTSDSPIEWNTAIRFLKQAWFFLASSMPPLHEKSSEHTKNSNWRSIFSSRYPSDPDELFQSDVVIRGFEVRKIGFNSIQDLVQNLDPSYLFSSLRSIELVKCSVENKHLPVLAQWLGKKQNQNETLQLLDLSGNRFDPDSFLNFLENCPTCSALKVLHADFSSQTQISEDNTISLFVSAFGDKSHRFPRLESLMLPRLLNNTQRTSYNFFASNFFFPELKEVQITEEIDENLLWKLKDTSIWSLLRSFSRLSLGVSNHQIDTKKFK